MRIEGSICSDMDISPRTSLLTHTPSSTSDLDANTQPSHTGREQLKQGGPSFLNSNRKTTFQRDDRRYCCCMLELLHKITDIILITCAIIFVASSIVYFALNIYGLYRFHNKRQIL